MSNAPPRIPEFDEFVRARSHSLMRAAYLLTGDQYLAEDLVQTALSRTLRAWKRLERSSNVEAYTRKIMYHLQVNWWRRKAAERRVNRLHHRQEVQPDGSETIAARLALQEALARLTAKQRAVLVLRYFEDRSITDTAEILGCSEGTVKSQTSKALTSLRQRAPQLKEFREALT